MSILSSKGYLLFISLTNKNTIIRIRKIKLDIDYSPTKTINRLADKREEISILNNNLIQPPIVDIES